MMFESLTLQGFQSHKRFEVVFGKTITSIVGVNDIGKTSLLRGLYWITNNEPHGNQFINWDMDYCKGILEVDGHRIVRYKSKSKNYYKLDDNKPHKAPGFGVPSDIAKILNVNRINFQFQRDPIFLLGSSSGQISRDLNAVIDLEVMDRFLANVQSEVRHRTTEEKIIKERLRDAKQREKDLEWVVELDTDLQHCEQMRTVIDEIREDCNTIQDGMNRINSLKEIMEETIPDISEVVNLSQRRSMVYKAIMDIESSIEQYRYMEKLVKETEKELGQQIKKLGNVCPTCGRDWE